jgi:L-threonylcarbamoyladenylate synthase
MASHDKIAEAVARLRSGGLVAFPTETVYGLGAAAREPLAVRRIYAAKGRPAGHPLIVHLGRAEQAWTWGQTTKEAELLAQAFWPGPLTLIVRRAPWVPDEVTGGRQTIGLRVPAHPVAHALLEAFGDGIAAPSANRFGHISPTTAAHVRAELGEDVMVLDGGPCAVGIESTIVDLSGDQPALLRLGGTAESEISSLVGPLGRSQTVAPGTLAQHYSPTTALQLSEDLAGTAARLRAQGLSVETLPAGDPAEHARALYAELRRLDGLGVDVLVAEPSSHGGLGLAINDRLERASAGSGFPQAVGPGDDDKK